MSYTFIDFKIPTTKRNDSLANSYYYNNLKYYQTNLQYIIKEGVVKRAQQLLRSGLIGRHIVQEVQIEVRNLPREGSAMQGREVFIVLLGWHL